VGTEVAAGYPSRLGSNAFGVGLYAVTDLPAGAAVERFEGPVVRYGEVPESELRFAILIGEDRWLIPRGAARHVNHSCNPNCRVDEALRIVTRRPVQAGEELCFAYNWIHPEERAAFAGDPARFSWDRRWTFRCRCGESRCQGTIDRYRIEEEEMVEVRTVPAKGRGVFAVRPFAPGERIESAPVIVVPAAEWPLVEKTVFFHYSYSWGPRLTDAAVALGCGSLYNHSYTPNARYDRNLAEQRIDFVALREIAPGEEITINYNGAADDRSPLWFEALP